MRRVCLVLAVVVSGVSYASEGVLLMGDDAIREAQAGAGVASPQDASWILFNPAGIVDLDRRMDFGMTMVYARATLHTRGLATVPFMDEMTDDLVRGLPSFQAVWPCGNDVFGLAFNVPAGAMIHFSKSRTWVGLLESNTDRNLDFMQPRLTLAYAHKFDSEWAVGFTANGGLSLARTDQMTGYLLPTRGENGWDHAFNTGLSAGVYRAWDRLSLGAAYTSRQWSQVLGNYRDISPYTVDLPATVQAGVAFRIVPKLELNVDYRFINWSNIKFFHNLNTENGLGWHDQNGIMCGLAWEATPKWTFRAGYSHVSSAMSDAHVMGSGLVPNVVQDHIGLGFSHVLSERSELHVTYGHWFHRDQQESGKGDIYSHLGKGTSMGLTADWITVGYTRKF